MHFWPTGQSGSFCRIVIGSILILLLIAGCSPHHYREQTDKRVAAIIANKQREGLGQEQPFTISPAEMQLRQQLVQNQQLAISGPASLGSDHLERPAHWPEAINPEPEAPAANNEPLSLDLISALKVAARNSRDYQSAKEVLFRSALALDYQHNAFSTLANGQLEGEYLQDRSGQTLEGAGGTIGGGVTRLLKSGISLSTQLGWDLVKIFQPGSDLSSGLYGDASITIPLLRGAGRHIAAEPLTQAERDTLYAVWTFERYKQEFAVSIIANYLGVLQAEDLLYNQEQNYKGLVVSTRRASRLAEAGKLPQIQVDQALQNELRARERWISARLSLASANDDFKLLLGLPTDATIQLDRRELNSLETDLRQRLKFLFRPFPPEQAAAADSPVTLLEPDPTLAGPLELDYATASNIALQQRLDLRIVTEQVTDAQRQVIITADALRAELTLLGSAGSGTSRSIAALQPDNSNRLKLDEGNYQALLTLDLPFERTAEAIAYRDSYISLEEAVRAVQELEDQIKLEVRDNLRELQQSRSSLRIQDQAVKLAERRVRGAELQLQAGRAEMRDLLDAQEALLSAKNSLTSAMVNYRLAELALQRDLGVLKVDENALLQEYTPEKADS